MKFDLNRDTCNRRAFLGRCGFMISASALSPSLLKADGELALGDPAPPEKPYGSGHFGEWITDEFGLPAYHYTCDQTKDPKAVSPTDPVFRAPTDQTHQVGNDRLVAAVSNYGYVQVRQDEGAPKFLNDYAPERGQFGAGIGYLTDGKEVLGTFYPGTGKSFDRIFGAGYLRKQVAGERYSVDHVIFAPFGDDPVIISQVTITNHGPSKADLRWVEYWGCQVYQFSYRSWMQASSWNGVSAVGTPGKAVDLRRKFGDRFAHTFERLDSGAGLLESKRFLGRTAEDERLWQAVQDAAAGRASGDFASLADSVGSASMEDLNPPPTFLASLDAPVDAWSTDGKAFFGTGGALHPTGLEQQLNSELRATGQESALLLERRIHLESGESRTLHFLYGYVPAGFSAADLVRKYQKDIGELWARSSQQWKENGITLSTPVEPWVEREITWSHYYVRSNMTYDDFFQEHILSQSGEYQYPWGFQGAARDPLQHALPLIFTAPEFVKEVLRYTLKEVRPNGSIPYGIVGHGMQMPTSQDDASDLPLWLLWVASEYVLATRDRNFLYEEMPTNMVNGPAPGKATVHSVLALCFRHMMDGVGKGPHGLIRMLMDDWLDGLVYDAVDLKWRDEYIHHGESVYNSAMGAYVFGHYARMLEFVGDDDELRRQVSASAKQCREAVSAQWAGRWFRRAWLGEHSGWLGTDNLWMEPQPWAIVGGCATPEQARTLVDAMDELLRRPSAIGAVMWNRGSATSAKGNQDWVPPADWINTAPALDGMLVWGLAMVDGKLAWDEWRKSSLARHAEAYPDVWYGIWSASDSYNGPSHQFAGRETPSDAVLGKGTNDFSVVDFPVMNAHAHAWPLYSAAKLLGIEFTPRGVELRPALPLSAYKFSSRLLGLEKSARGYEGWYATGPHKGTWKVALHLPPDEIKRATRVEVNGIEAPLHPMADGVIEMTGESADKPLRWSARITT